MSIFLNRRTKFKSSLVALDVILSISFQNETRFEDISSVNQFDL